MSFTPIAKDKRDSRNQDRFMFGKDAKLSGFSTSQGKSQVSSNLRESADVSLSVTDEVTAYISQNMKIIKETPKTPLKDEARAGAKAFEPQCNLVDDYSDTKSVGSSHRALIEKYSRVQNDKAGSGTAMNAEEQFDLECQIVPDYDELDHEMSYMKKS